MEDIMRAHNAFEAIAKAEFARKYLHNELRHGGIRLRHRLS